MNNEAQNVFERYEKRKNNLKVQKDSGNYYFNHYAKSERDLKYIEIVKSRFENSDTVKILEIGAGSGGNLFLFKQIGFSWKNIFANELLPDRIELLKDNFPLVQIFEGDACEISEDLYGTFDIVFQSTVFTSILDFDFKKKLAKKMWSLLKPGGIILWYDFTFDNPQNKDVKGIRKDEIKKLFTESNKVTFNKTTLAPPIGRRVKKLYPFFNLFPFLRTHLIAVIEKPAGISDTYNKYS